MDYGDYGYYDSLAGLGTLSIILLTVILLIIVLIIGADRVSTAVIFMKAGEAPWKSLIPFYDMYTFFKLCWNVKMFIPYIAIYALGVLISLLTFGYTFQFSLNGNMGSAEAAGLIGSNLARICSIVCLFFYVMLSYHISKSFNKSGGFTVGLVLLNVIFKMMLAFGDAEYKYQPNPGPSPSYQTGNLRCISGDICGTEIEMRPGEVITVGRRPEFASLVVDQNNPKKQVSKRHFEVEFAAEINGYYLTDTSSNGTILGDGTKLIRGVKTPVKRGSIVILPHDIKFMLD